MCIALTHKHTLHIPSRLVNRVMEVHMKLFLCMDSPQGLIYIHSGIPSQFSDCSRLTFFFDWVVFLLLKILREIFLVIFLVHLNTTYRRRQIQLLNSCPLRCALCTCISCICVCLCPLAGHALDCLCFLLSLPRCLLLCFRALSIGFPSLLGYINKNDQRSRDSSL